MPIPRRCVQANRAKPRLAACPACGFHVCVPFYDGGRQPLATLGWPASEAQACSMPRLPLDFVCCIDCGHVFNARFHYRSVPYSDQPNRMYNRGRGWSSFLEEVLREILRKLPRNPVVAEIGYGDGRFLDALARRSPDGRFVGFDPHGSPEAASGRVELRRCLFDPFVHLGELRPHLLISRHVLEHLANPLGFVQSLAAAAVLSGVQLCLYLEVPCVDRAIETGRLGDFYYEHNSHFTTASFLRMIDRSGARLESAGHGYGGEVIFGFLRIKGRTRQAQRARQALDFQAAVEGARGRIGDQLAEIASSGKRLAVWGGTGKCAAFLNAHGMDAKRFPLVVDSDAAKTGTFVPGTGQKILPPGDLLRRPAAVILIPCQWRAADIVGEIGKLGLNYERILIEHGGRLIDYFRHKHPYGRAGSRAREAGAA